MKILVVGSAHLDAIAYVNDACARDNVGYARFFAGGAAFNIAAWLAHYRQDVRLFTYLRKNSYLGDAIYGVVAKTGVKTDYVFRETSVCDRLLEDSAFIAHVDARTRSLMSAVSAVGIGDLELPDSVREVRRLAKAIDWAEACVVDCNLSPSSIAHICRTAKAAGRCLAVAGVSSPKLRRYVDLALGEEARADWLCANHEEIASLFDSVKDRALISRLSGRTLSAADATRIVKRVSAHRVSVSNEKGFFVLSRGAAAFLAAPSIARDNIVSTTGAGDTLAACILTSYAKARAADFSTRLQTWQPEPSAHAVINDGIARCLMTHGAAPFSSLSFSPMRSEQSTSMLERIWLRVQLKAKEIVEERLVEYGVVGAVAFVLYLLGNVVIQ